MSAEFEAVPDAVSETVCPVCGSDVASSAVRCRACGMHLGGTAAVSPFRGLWFWGFSGGLATVYVLTIIAVAFAR